MADKTNEKRIIQSVERVGSILDYLAEKPRGERLSVLARELGLNKSTAFGLVSSLEALDLLNQDEETGRYSLGVKLLRYGAAYQKNTDMISVAAPLLSRLAEEYHETTHMAVRMGNEAAYVAKAESSKSIRIASNVGGTMPLYCTAIGKILLTALSEEDLRAYMQNIRFVRYTRHTVTDGETLLRELQEVRRSGLAYDRCEREEGLVCIAAAVRDLHGRVVSAVSMSMPEDRFERYQARDLEKSVLTTAREISHFLGY